MIGGCDLRFWALAAPAYSAVLSMLEMTWCVQILFTRKSVTSDEIHWYPWNFIEKLHDSEAIMRFTVISFVLHLLWLISSLIMIFQMKTPKDWMTSFWLFSTFLVTLWSVSTSIYYTVQLNNLRSVSISPVRKKVVYNSYFMLLLIFSGGFLFYTVNICLLVFLGRKWMDSCIFCQKTGDHRGFYRGLFPTSNRDSSDSNSALQMEDVIFDAREFRTNEIFHINEKTSARTLNS